MIIRVNDIEHDELRVPILFHWKNQRIKKAFAEEVVAIDNFKSFVPLKAFSHVKVESGVFKPSAGGVAVKFKDQAEKSKFLRTLYDLADDSNMYVACPDDITYNVISAWVKNSLTDMGIKPNTPIDISD